MPFSGAVLLSMTEEDHSKRYWAGLGSLEHWAAFECGSCGLRCAQDLEGLRIEKFGHRRP